MKENRKTFLHHDIRPLNKIHSFGTTYMLRILKALIIWLVLLSKCIAKHICIWGFSARFVISWKRNLKLALLSIVVTRWPYICVYFLSLSFNNSVHTFLIFKIYKLWRACNVFSGTTPGFLWTQCLTVWHWGKYLKCKQSVRNEPEYTELWYCSKSYMVFLFYFEIKANEARFSVL